MYNPANPDMKRVTFGKHTGKTFAQAYTLRHYVKWVLDLENAFGRLRELQEYFVDNEGIVLPPAPKKMYRRNHNRCGLRGSLSASYGKRLPIPIISENATDLQIKTPNSLHGLQYND